MTNTTFTRVLLDGELQEVLSNEITLGDTVRDKDGQDYFFTLTLPKLFRNIKPGERFWYNNTWYCKGEFAGVPSGMPLKHMLGPGGDGSVLMANPTDRFPCMKELV